MKKIETIWTALEVSATKGGGILYRRYSAAIVPSLFVAIRRTDLNRCLALVFSDREAAKKIEKVSMKGLEFEVQDNPSFPNQYLLLIVLSDRRNEDVFATLAEDLIAIVSNEHLEEKVIAYIHMRVLIWKSLFDDTIGSGLSLDAQLGLFGELTLLKTLLQLGKKSITTYMESWIGPVSGNRDFEIGGWAVEVKTTRTNQHQKVLISNERQLDDTHFEKLFLCCYSFEVQQSARETLNALVNEVRNLLVLHPSDLVDFERKLIFAGYLAKHFSLYEDYGFIQRSQGIYRVTSSFPCIRERDVPNGVGDVSYSIMISSLSNYAVDISELLN